MLYKRIGLIALMLLVTTMVAEVMAYSGESKTYPPNITLSSPINNTIYTYTTTQLDFNWTSNDTLISNMFGFSSGNLSGVKYCSQETANTTNSCGGLNTGKYGWSANINDPVAAFGFDESYSGDAVDTNNGLIGYFYVNYTKPTSVQNTSRWMVQGCTLTNASLLTTWNGASQINCWAQNPLQFRTVIRDSNPLFHGDCWDGSSWQMVAVCGASQSFYEERMEWRFNYTTNITQTLSRGRYNISMTGYNNRSEQGETTQVSFGINNQPNATNVSITPLPITQGNTLTGHCLYSDSDNDQAGGNQTYWYQNNSMILTANNSFILLGGNTSEFSNITFSCRYNDTYDWSDWINSSVATVGDSTSPILSNWTLQYTNLNDASGNTNQFNVTTTDALSNIQTISFDLNGSINVSRSFTFSPFSTVTTSYSIFSSQETLLQGTYNITRLTISDSSGNSANFFINQSFTVSAQPSSGSAGGGGGSSSVVTTVVIDETSKGCNHDKICQGTRGEDFINCNTDCKFSVSALTCDDPTQSCFFKNATAARIILVVLILSIILVATPQNTKNDIKKSLGIR